MEIVYDTDASARLANTRILIRYDNDCARPDKTDDMLFSPKNSDVYGFEVFDKSDPRNKIICYADSEQLDAEIKAGNFKNKDEINDWLSLVKNAEKKRYQDWYDGEVYQAIVQKYNAAERCFETIEAYGGIFGWQDLLAEIEDINEELENSGVTVDAVCIARYIPKLICHNGKQFLI